MPGKLKVIHSYHTIITGYIKKVNQVNLNTKMPLCLTRNRNILYLENGMHSMLMSSTVNEVPKIQYETC